MSKQLAISEDLSLPIDAATQTFAFIARKGAGKTYAAGKLTELLMDAGVQCVILDTVGNWYGLRLGADGKSAGFDIPVLGGLRGDIPLEATGGELVAELVVDTGRSIIIDLSQFSLADRKRFATAFAIRLWARKKAERDPSPVHLVIEESQLIIPETTRGDDARMVGIYEEIIRLGRNYGIGVSMISQRPQSVNKEVLNQTECLFVLQVNGAHERKALKEWVTHQGVDVNLVNELPGLDIGVSYVWSPQWLKVLKKVKIAAKRTFDASATPKVGTRRQLREPAPLDLAAFKDRMQATIEKAKENDPVDLKRTIASLKREMEQAKSATPAPAPLIAESDRISLGKLLDRTDGIHAVLASMSSELSKVSGVIHDSRTLMAQITAHVQAKPISRPSARIERSKDTRHAPDQAWRASRLTERAAAGSNGEEVEISGGLRRMMIALAQRPGLTKKQLGVRAGLSSSSGTFSTYLGRMRSNHWVHRQDPLVLTEAGMEALGQFDPLPQGEELLQFWLRELGDSGAGRMLRALADAWPRSLTKQDLGDKANISPASGTFSTYLGKLRTLELVEGRGELTASKEFFE